MYCYTRKIFPYTKRDYKPGQETVNTINLEEIKKKPEQLNIVDIKCK
jgi:hypothetical protein